MFFSGWGSFKTVRWALSQNQRYRCKIISGSWWNSTVWCHSMV